MKLGNLQGASLESSSARQGKMEIAGSDHRHALDVKIAWWRLPPDSWSKPYSMMRRLCYFGGEIAIIDNKSASIAVRLRDRCRATERFLACEKNWKRGRKKQERTQALPALYTRRIQYRARRIRIYSRWKVGSRAIPSFSQKPTRIESR